MSSSRIVTRPNARPFKNLTNHSIVSLESVETVPRDTIMQNVDVVSINGGLFIRTQNSVYSDRNRRLVHMSDAQIRGLAKLTGLTISSIKAHAKKLQQLEKDADTEDQISEAISLLRKNGWNVSLNTTNTAAKPPVKKPRTKTNRAVDQHGRPSTFNVTGGGN